MSARRGISTLINCCHTDYCILVDGLGWLSFLPESDLTVTLSHRRVPPLETPHLSFCGAFQRLPFSSSSRGNRGHATAQKQQLSTIPTPPGHPVNIFPVLLPALRLLGKTICTRIQNAPDINIHVAVLNKALKESVVKSAVFDEQTRSPSATQSKTEPPLPPCWL